LQKFMRVNMDQLSEQTRLEAAQFK